MVIATRTRNRWRRYSASMRAPSVIGGAACPVAKAANRDFTARPGCRGRQVETEFPFCVNLEHSFHFVQTARNADDPPCLADRPDRGPCGLFAEGAGHRTAGPAVATVAAAGETAPTAQDGANGVAIWVHPEDSAQSLILGAGGTGGLEVYGLDGALKQRVSDIEASQVMVRYGFEIGGAKRPLVLAYDPMRSTLDRLHRRRTASSSACPARRSSRTTS